MKPTPYQALIRITALTAIFSALALPAFPQSATPADAPRTTWDPRIVETFSDLPIQSAGRVKPMSTFARFELVKLSGKASYKSEAGDRLSAVEWLLDTIFRPESARHYKVILIENPHLMHSLGLPDDKKRARFSHAEMEAVEAALVKQAQRINEIPDEKRSPFEKQMYDLYFIYAGHLALLDGLEFARWRAPLQPDEPLGQLLTTGRPETADPQLRYSEVLAAASQLGPMVLKLAQADQQGTEPPTLPVDSARLTKFVQDIGEVAFRSKALTIIPPTAHPEMETWQSPGDLWQMSLVGHAPAQEVNWLVQLEKLVAQRERPEEFLSTLGALRREVLAAADVRGEAAKLGLERDFYKWNFFKRGLILYILGFLLVACTWLFPRNRALNWTAWAMVLIPTLLLIAGITVRCILRNRPPVSTLYETTLFIPAVAICVALVMEVINRKRIALAVASALGVLGLLIANTYELKDGADTMPRLVAVLDSNFWLSTHVITVTIGYSAGLLAAAMGHIYIFGRVFGRGRNEPFFKSTARMVYGVVCFGTLFSFVGTVLGGIWANYSWGRFWGWDPKENGALLIIIWNLVILHARLGGYIREMGLCLAAVFGSIVVSFSWWGVNLLGVGLHSYGFTSGIMNVLMAFWVFEAAVILMGLAGWQHARQHETEPAANAPVVEKKPIRSTS